uniref:Xaa-Pro aminopeptidase n=1 Tax=Hirondellea gigas TaxID=1518452 RepID=A0A2P2I3N1_9CRUS
MFSKETYIERRKKLKSGVKSGIILITGNPESSTDYPDNTYYFAQDGTFRYYFGIDRADMFGVIDLDNDKDYIFGYDYTISDVIWMGVQPTLKEEAVEFGIEHTGSCEDLKLFLDKNSAKQIHFQPQYRGKNIIALGELLNKTPKDIKNGGSDELCYAVASQRNFKSAEEIEKIEEAVNVTRAMHLKVMQTTKVGMKEYEVVSNIQQVLIANHCTDSFPTICSTNGQTLHNHYYGNTLESGRMLLVDCGAKSAEGYCGDMTTTFPVDAKFTPKQKEIYNVLIDAYDHTESILKAGITYKEVHLSTCAKIVEGLKSLGLIVGNIDEAVKNGVQALFMPHGLGHMMGMDVHDMENFGEVIVGYNGEAKSTQFGLSSLRLGRVLEDGFVFTVEPGIYFIPDLIKKWKDEGTNSEFLNFDKIEEYLDFGGMRYEGDYVIENGKSRRLGLKMPKTVEEVELERAKAYKN